MDRAEAGSAVTGLESWRPELGQVDGLDLQIQHGSEPTGGDFFDVVRVGQRVAFLLSDVAGRRPEVDPILTAMQEAFQVCSAQLFGNAGNLMEGTELLVQAVSHALIGVAGVRYAPTFVGCYDVQLGVLAYINAGGKTALLHDSEGTRALPNASMPLGLFPSLTYDASMQAFEPGAMLLVVSKGVTESMGGKNSFSPERVIEVLTSTKHASAKSICRAVLDTAQRFHNSRWEWLPLRRAGVQEDMTALAMVRKFELE